MDTSKSEVMRSARGLVAALDQSGGSSVEAMRRYGLSEASLLDDEQVQAAMESMRARVLDAPSFVSGRVIGAIMFEQTVQRAVAGVPLPAHLWAEHRIVTFVRVDRGLAERRAGVQLVPEMEWAPRLMAEAVERGVFGTKQRAVIHEPDPEGIRDLVEQQFRIGREARRHGLVPMVEPDVLVAGPDRLDVERILHAELSRHLDDLGPGEQVVLKLALPSRAGFYRSLVDHPNVMRVLALSGGMSRERALDLLAQNDGVIASFSRALMEGLSIHHTDAQLDAVLDASLRSIYDASTVSA